MYSSRERKRTVLFDPTPLCDRDIRAALAERLASGVDGRYSHTRPSEISAEHGFAATQRKQRAAAEAAAAAVAAAEEAARVEAATPRPLPFSAYHPPKERTPQTLLLMPPPEALFEPGTERGGPARRPSAASVPFRPADDALLRSGAGAAGGTIDVVSEFTGIGAFEHGLTAGFEEGGLELRLVEASELETTSTGVHASRVLRKRFPHCEGEQRSPHPQRCPADPCSAPAVLNPEERARAYPPKPGSLYNVYAQLRYSDGSLGPPGTKGGNPHHSRLRPRLRIRPHHGSHSRPPPPAPPPPRLRAARGAARPDRGRRAGRRVLTHDQGRRHPPLRAVVRVVSK